MQESGAFTNSLTPHGQTGNQVGGECAAAVWAGIWQNRLIDIWSGR